MHAAGRFRPGRATQLIPPVLSLFTRISPIFPPSFLRVFTVSTRRFQRAPSRNPGPRNGGTSTKSRELGPSFNTPDAVGRISWCIKNQFSYSLREAVRALSVSPQSVTDNDAAHGQCSRRRTVTVTVRSGGSTSFQIDRARSPSPQSQHASLSLLSPTFFLLLKPLLSHAPRARRSRRACCPRSWTPGTHHPPGRPASPRC